MSHVPEPGGALLFPATLALVATGFAEGRERNRAHSVWAAAGGSGLILGSLLGGVLTRFFGWEAVFFVNVPLAGAALVAAFLLIPPDPPGVAGRSFDLPGALTGTAGVPLLVLALVRGPEAGWTSVPVRATAVTAVALLVAFVLIEVRSKDPLMPLRLFGHRNLAVGTGVTTAFTATFGTVLYFLTSSSRACTGTRRCRRASPSSCPSS